MADNRLFVVIMRDLEGNSSAFTDRTNEIQLKKVGCHILEMEDVLFHHDSCVLMPENPEGKSSRDGEKDDGPADLGDDFHEDQLSMTGIEALALVFKQFELDPNKRMVTAGHTDTSGKADYNFPLSEERAQNVHYLITGKREDWAKVSANRHKIEDYQQIMQYFHWRKKTWDCDPIGIDNRWGPKTKTATENFLRNALKDKRDSGYIEGLIQRIKNDPKKRWPEEAWLVVFDLYAEVLCDIIEIKPEELENHAEKNLKYIDDEKKYVACGESFPLDDRQKKNYRSQTNRRVEVLFFDKDEKPTLHCPKPDKKVHKEEECPLWDKTCYLPLYIDPLDLYAVVYHLRFIFLDRKKNKIVSVPEGLEIKAFQNGTEEIPTVTLYKKGIYHVKVQFETPLDDPNRTSMHFEFEIPDLFLGDPWVSTKDGSPKIIRKTTHEMKSIDLAERYQYYYDLPKRWTAQQYWMRYEGSDKDIMEGKDKGGNFFFTLRDTLKLKPFGSNVTSAKKPMIFCLDDIILTDKDLNPDTIPAGKEGALLDKNFGVIDPDKGSNKSYYTKGNIKGKQVPFSGKVIYGIIVEGKLYAVFRDRVAKGAFGGHRAAVYDHKTKGHLEKNFNQQHPRTDIGHLDLYLINEQGFENNEEISYLFNYVRWQFDGVKDPEKPGEPAFNADDRWIDETITNITGFFNNKDKNTKKEKLASIIYQDNTTKTMHRTFIRYYLEHVTSGRHTLIEVFPAGSAGRSNMSYSKGQLRADQNKPHPGLPESKSHLKGRFTAAHEFGHATSLEDDYTERSKNASYRLPGFDSFYPGSPYYQDSDAMMRYNRESRARYYWHLSEWLYSMYSNDYYIDVGSKHVYNLPHFSIPAGNDISTYITNPLSSKDDIKSPTNRHCYDLALYPLGADQYSLDVFAPGHTVDGILVVLVKMKYDFKEDESFLARKNTLIKTAREINRSFNANNNNWGKWYVEGDHKGLPNYKFKKCVVYFFSRFLVKNFPKASDPKVEDYAKSVYTITRPRKKIYTKNAGGNFDYNATKTKYNSVVNHFNSDKHFDIIVRKPDFFEGHSAKWDSPTGKKLTISYGWFTDTEELLLREFPKMIGINKKAEDVVGTDLLPLVSHLIQNAKVKKF